MDVDEDSDSDFEFAQKMHIQCMYMHVAYKSNVFVMILAIHIDLSGPKFWINCLNSNEQIPTWSSVEQFSRSMISISKRN